jgi:hypothetical protein
VLLPQQPISGTTARAAHLNHHLSPIMSEASIHRMGTVLVNGVRGSMRWVGVFA